MKKYFLYLAIFISSFYSALVAQTYLPVATSGYNLDGVAENTTAVSTTGSAALDNSDFVIYSQYYGTLYSGGTVGIPNNGLIASGTRTYQLQSYTGSNALRINGSNKDSITFTNPQAFPSISLLSFATQGNATMSITIRFTDNSTQTFSSVSVVDWFTANTAIISGFDRALRTTGTPALVGSAGNPRMFGTDLAIACANQGKLIKRVIIQNTSTAIVIIMAVSGAVPAYSVNAPAFVCAGSAATLAATGFATYTWQAAGSFAGSNTGTVTDSPSSTTAYTLTGTDVSGCPGYTVVTVNVNGGLPTLSFAGSTASVCLGAPATISVSGANTYTLGSPAANGATFAVSTSTTYTVAGTNACGTSTASTAISVQALPNVTASASSPSLCSGSSLTLTGVGNATAYTWSGGPSGIIDGTGFSPGASANYTVIGTSALSCTAAATISVQVVQTPSIAPTASPLIVCIGNSSTLTATGASNYTWTGGSAVGNNSTYVVSPTNLGISTYTVRRANSTCTSSAQISVVTNSLPTVFAIANPTLVCASNQVSLAVAGGQSYTWTSPGNPPSVNAFTFGVGNANPIVYPPVNSVYTVAATDGTCVNTTTVAVATNPNPTLIVSPSSTSLCAGQTVSLSVTGGNNYTWTSTSSSNTITTSSFTDAPGQSSAYYVTGDNSFGCFSQLTQVIVVYNNPTLTTQVASNRTLVCSGGNSTISVSGANTYTWSSGTAAPSGTSVVVTSTNIASGPVIYTVTGATSSTGCQSTKTVIIHVFIPTLAVSGTPSTCIGGNITLSASGGNINTYTWTSPGNPPQIGFSVINTTLGAAAVFTVAAFATSLTSNCPGSQTVAVDIYANPIISATAQRTVICTKEHVVLSASGGTAYSWSNGQITPTINVNPTSNTTYTVNGTDINGCSGTGTVSVKVSGCAGIIEQSGSSALAIYPNPNSGEFFVESDSDIELSVINELGQNVKTLKLVASENYKALVGNLSPGIYFLNGTKNGTVIKQKIIVAK